MQKHIINTITFVLTYFHIFKVPKQLFTSPHPQRRPPVKVPRPLTPSGSKDPRDPRDPRDQNESMSPSKKIIESEVPDSEDVKLWPDMSKLKRHGDYRPNRSEPVSVVAVSADNLWVFSASHDDVIRMYSLEVKSDQWLSVKLNQLLNL